MKLTDQQIAGILQEEITRASGSDLEGGELAANREKATDYILGRKGGGDPPAGTSEYVSQDIGDSIDALLGELLPSFSGDVVARFEANGPNDDTAAVESDVVSEFIMDRNPGAVILHNAIWSILAHKNAVIKVWIEDQVQTDVKEFDDAQAAAGAAAMGEEEGWTATIDGLTVTVSRPRKKLRIDCIEPEHFIYASNHRSIFLDGIRFCGEICYYTRDELSKLGVPPRKLRKVGTTGPESKSDAVAKRIAGQSSWNDSQTFDQQEVRCISGYRLMPKGLNDTATESELWWFLYADDDTTVLKKKRADFLPYAAGAAWLVPGRFEGVSAYDKLKPIQDAKSDGVRQILENMRAANNGKTAHNERVDPDDVLNQRAGATIAVEGEMPVGDAIMQLGATDILSQGLALLQYLDSVRTERVGASLDMAEPEFQIAGDTAHGTERMMSAREVRSGKNALMISETLVRSTWLLVHKTLRRQWRGTVSVSVKGEWTEVSPSEWNERERVNITHGMSPGERNRRVQALGRIAQQQVAAIDGGLNGILTDYDRIYNTAMDMSRAAGIEAPERHWIDPRSASAQQAAQGQAEQAQAQAAEQKQVTDMALQLEQMDRRLKEQELQFKYFDARLDAEVELAKAEVSAGTEITKALESSNGNGQANSAAGQSRSQET